MDTGPERDCGDKPAWRQKLDFAVDTMREMSLKTDPQDMVKAYGQRVQKMLPSDRRVSLSRRGLKHPQFRVTRYSGWVDEVNPWKQQNRLPMLEGGILASLLYGNEPRIIDHFRLEPGDPAAEYLTGLQSLMAIPLFDGGEGINMVVLGMEAPGAFDCSRLPEWVWMSNLFGRAAQTLVIADELRSAYEALNREINKVGQIQRTLLPDPLPKIPSLDLAAYYQTSQQAGGDHYDCFRLDHNRWGLLVADVSGHGPPAAVVQAMTHGLGHAYAGPDFPPSRLLTFMNDHLSSDYTSRIGAFVTAFYGIYDTSSHTMTYSSAGHNPPRLKRCSDGTISSLDAAQSLPLGIQGGSSYLDASLKFIPGDQVVFYTDGITEAMNPVGQMFGVERLDAVLENCALTADGLIKSVIEAVDSFAAGHPADDDRTMLVAKVV